MALPFIARYYKNIVSAEFRRFDIMVYHGIPWCTMVYRGMPWYTLVQTMSCHGKTCDIPTGGDTGGQYGKQHQLHLQLRTGKLQCEQKHVPANCGEGAEADAGSR